MRQDVSKSLRCGSCRKEQRGRLASSSNLSGLGGAGPSLVGLAPGPGVIRAGEGVGLGVLDWLVCIGKLRLAGKSLPISRNLLGCQRVVPPGVSEAPDGGAAETHGHTAACQLAEWLALPAPGA